MLELCIAIAAGTLLAAAVWDFTSRIIPNALSVVTAASFGVAAAVATNPLDFWPAVLVGAGLFAVGSGLFALKWLGGGDVKLMAAAGLWAGIDRLDQFLLVTALTGGALGAVMWTQQRIGGKRLSTGSWRENDPVTVPYGVAIACGGLVVLAGRFEAGAMYPWA